jgi:hypothetical protein
MTVGQRMRLSRMTVGQRMRLSRMTVGQRMRLSRMTVGQRMRLSRIIPHQFLHSLVQYTFTNITIAFLATFNRL